MEPQINADKHRLDAVSEQIIGCAFRVANTLGCGFLEKVYENALVHEIRKSGLSVDQQKGIKVIYDNVVVGEYVPDILVENAVVVEAKSVKSLDDVHFAQCLNYLRASDLKLCLLINFGTPKVSIKRVVHNL